MHALYGRACEGFGIEGSTLSISIANTIERVSFETFAQLSVIDQLKLRCSYKCSKLYYHLKCLLLPSSSRHT